MNALNCELKRYNSTTKKYIALVVTLILLTLILNVLLCVFRTESTHIAFLIINVLSGIVAAWVSIFLITVKIQPRRKLTEFYLRGQKYSAKRTGTVLNISEQTCCVQGFNCFEISLEEKPERKIFVIENGGIILSVGQKYIISTVDNIAIEAEAAL